ncbi:MAG: hypothetical protein ABGY41_18130, partial [Candidatus Poribacteria bacterium]
MADRDGSQTTTFTSGGTDVSTCERDRSHTPFARLFAGYRLAVLVTTLILGASVAGCAGRANTEIAPAVQATPDIPAVAETP